MAFRDGRHRGGLHPSGPERREGAEGAGFFAAERARGAPQGRGKKFGPRLAGGPGDHRNTAMQPGARLLVDELMNRGLITGIGGQRTETREKRG